MQYLYFLFIQLYQFSLQLAASWHPKARLWVKGRKDWQQQLSAVVKDQHRVIWMHCSSVGEFEQGRPILEALGTKYPSHFVVLSFFSPSGYEARKNTQLADYVCYLPLDSAQNASRWLDILNPELSIFVKYDFWFYYLSALKKRNSLALLIAGVFRPSQWFFQWYGRWALPMLEAFDFCFLQDEASAQTLKKAGFNNYQVTGDPRVDRVLQIAAAAASFPIIEQFKGEHPAFIIGSSWPADEQHLLSILPGIINKGWKIIIAPHEVNLARIDQLEHSLPFPALRYSNCPVTVDKSPPILIIDNIGMLASLYRYGDIAYVGGGFGKSIHNLLEPTAHGLPVIFGPAHKKIYGGGRSTLIRRWFPGE